MVWGGRRDHLKEGMIPLSCVPLSLAGYPRGLFIWLFIQRSSSFMILYIIWDYMQENISYQITLIKYLKLWRLMQF